MADAYLIRLALLGPTREVTIMSWFDSIDAYWEWFYKNNLSRSFRGGYRGADWCLEVKPDER